VTTSQSIYDETLRSLIVGGQEAKEGGYPYQVVWYDDFETLCGGTLISPSHVLTAAHCFHEDGTERYVEIGRHNRSDPLEEFELILVKEVFVHPLFFDEKPKYDIMILKLQENSTFPSVTLDNGTHGLGGETELKVIGWGSTTSFSPYYIFGIPLPPFLSSFVDSLFSNDSTENEVDDRNMHSDILREVSLDLVTKEDCQKDFGILFKVTSHMMCASREGSGPCLGDSGGPLLLTNINGNSEIQVGIISFGIGCADSHYPGVYTKVSSFLTWIDAVINKEESISENMDDNLTFFSRFWNAYQNICIFCNVDLL